jgi:hypothetical protein
MNIGSLSIFFKKFIVILLYFIFLLYICTLKLTNEIQMAKSNNDSSTGFWFFIFSIILFSVLKIMGFVTLTWWWVTAPFVTSGILFLFFLISKSIKK